MGTGARRVTSSDHRSHYGSRGSDAAAAHYFRRGKKIHRIHDQGRAATRSHDQANLYGSGRRFSASQKMIARAEPPGSARVSRVGFGVAPNQSFLQISFALDADSAQRKFAIASTRSPARGTRSLPRR